MTVFLVGGTGLLGQALVPLLLARGHRVRAITGRGRPTSLPAGVTSVEIDLRAADLRPLVDGCDAVVHLATPLRPDGSATQANDDARLCCPGTRRLLDASLASGVSRYVQQSIVEAYRDGGGSWLDEQAPLDDSSARATTCRPVIEAEGMVRAIAPETLAWTILRAGSLVGAETAQSALVERLRTGSAVVPADGSNFVSLVNVVDMASAVVAALESAPAGSTFNVVDEPLRYGDYLDALADLIGVPRPERAEALPLPPSWRCTSRAAQTVLGWMPRERIWPYLDR